MSFVLGINLAFLNLILRRKLIRIILINFWQTKMSTSHPRQCLPSIPAVGKALETK